MTPSEAWEVLFASSCEECARGLAANRQDLPPPAPQWYHPTTTRACQAGMLREVRLVMSERRETAGSGETS